MLIKILDILFQIFVFCVIFGIFLWLYRFFDILFSNRLHDKNWFDEGL